MKFACFKATLLSMVFYQQQVEAISLRKYEFDSQTSSNMETQLTEVENESQVAQFDQGETTVTSAGSALNKGIVEPFQDTMTAPEDAKKVSTEQVSHLTDFLITATKDVSQAHPDDKPACTFAKHKALQELADNLLMKSNFHEEEKKVSMRELNEVSNLLKSHEDALAKTKKDQAELDPEMKEEAEQNLRERLKKHVM